MRTLTGSFSFSVPEPHPDAGQRLTKTFTYDQVESDSEAIDVIKAKGWSLTELVNDKLKSAARANAYQNALAPYRPSEVPPDQIRERVIRDLIRVGVPEDVARRQVEGLLTSTR
ncbi:MAG: hypothetical protein QXE45_04520 [Thermoplasmata archaeon]